MWAGSAPGDCVHVAAAAHHADQRLVVYVRQLCGGNRFASAQHIGTVKPAPIVGSLRPRLVLSQLHHSSMLHIQHGSQAGAGAAPATMWPCSPCPPVLSSRSCSPTRLSTVRSTRASACHRPPRTAQEGHHNPPQCGIVFMDKARDAAVLVIAVNCCCLVHAVNAPCKCLRLHSFASRHLVCRVAGRQHHDCTCAVH